jgi:hypothetical protein
MSDSLVPWHLVIVVVVLAVAVVCGTIGYRVGTARGRPTLGLMLGVIGCLIGLLILAAMPAKEGARR